MASEGQLVFIKSEGDKRSRRDIYIVLDRNVSDNTLTVCKVRDALSNRHASIVPQDERYRYTVKQTDIILAPNQPKITKYPVQYADQDYQEYRENNEYEGEECDDYEGYEDEAYQDEQVNDGEQEEETLDFYTITYRKPSIPDNTNPEPGEETEEEEELLENMEELIDARLSEEDEEIEEVQEENNVENIEVIENDSVTSDGEDEEAEPANDNQEENIDESEEEVHEDEEDVQQAQEAGIQEEQENNQGAAALVTDQSRRPAKGDIIAFVKGSFWTKAKITSKVAGYPYYFNIQYEDGILDGLYLRPPSENTTESWTFINTDLWTPLIVDHDITQGISQVDGADTPASLSPASSISSNTTPTTVGRTYPKLASVEEIIRAPMVMGLFLLESTEQAGQFTNNSADNSLDWDNYNSEPTFTSTNLAVSSFSPLDINTLDISLDTGSDVITLSQDDTVSEHDDQAPADVVPDLHRRADRVMSVINCSASTCKKHYKPPPS